ncbi:MAG: V-type ATP synthase subunit E [Spirochaetaceae bacterium]|jgi:V/A-type H+-transporting ATPase subunit E|nr:V-type ATP synthase subunit E [Spirochaetaceae bacterium]
MDIQLQELIEKIKKDGIESAGEEASKIKSQAEAEAKNIIEAARKEASGIVAKGKADAEKSEKAGIAAVQQAARNTILAFKDEVQQLLDKIVVRDTAAAMDAGLLKTVIPELLKNWAQKGGSGGIDVLLTESDLAKTSDFFRQELLSELKNGVEFKFGRGVSSGFRIAEKDGSAYYDFSAESVADFFTAYLNPQLAEVIKGAAKGM